MSSLSLNWKDLDNYLLVIATFIAGISALFSNTTVAFVVLGIGMIMKAIVSAIDPEYTIVENLDNIALALAGILSLYATLTNNTTWSLAIIAVGGFLKAVGSAYTRHAPLADNVDNVVLAAATSLAGIAIVLNQPQLATGITLTGALLKGLLSSYFRNKASAITPPVVTPPAVTPPV